MDGIRTRYLVMLLLAGSLTVAFGQRGTAETGSSLGQILGFEAPTVTDWSIIWGSAGTLSSSTTASQGARSLAVLTNGYTIIESAKLTSLGSDIDSIVRYDIRLPANLAQVSPSYYGETQLFVEIPSLGLYNAPVGQMNLMSFPLGEWKTVSFAVPSDILAKLRASYNDLRVRLVVNAPNSATAPFLLDNVRFSERTVATVKLLNRSGEPLMGNTVTAYLGTTPTNYSAVTDATGTATLSLPSGNYRFGISHDGIISYSDVCIMPGGCNDEILFDEETPTTLQGRADAFYDMENVVTIKVYMPDAEWRALRAEQPFGGTCNGDMMPPGQDRFTERDTTSVVISGTKYPAEQVTFTGVKIKKKSNCGSFTDGKKDDGDTDLHDKPAFKLKFVPTEGSPYAEDIIGTRHLTLNNSLQDDSYIRQSLGYYLYGKAGLPHSRSNFAQVYVNDVLVEDFELKHGVYVNVEPIRELYIDRPANNFVSHKNSTLYEFELGDDFVNDDTDENRTKLSNIDIENVSNRTTRHDIVLAARAMNTKGLEGLKEAMDYEHFIKTFAMEFLLGHWDGYTKNRNNSYVYNDYNTGGPEPTSVQNNFKLIPWGLDQILKRDWSYVSPESLASKLVVNDPTAMADLRRQVGVYRDNIFSRTNLEGDINAYIVLMESNLRSLGLGADDQKFIDGLASVRKHLGLVRSTAFVFAGMTGPDASSMGLYVFDRATGHVLDESTEGFPHPPSFEVIHRENKNASPVRWQFLPSKFGSHLSTLRTTALDDHYLHSSVTILTPKNHLFIYTANYYDLVYPKQDYWIRPVMENNRADKISPYFKLRNEQTGNYVRFGDDDPTPGGSLRVYQSGPLETDGSELFVY